MKNIKKKAYKTPLLIDFRPAQDFKHNGVTKATINWVNEIVRSSKSDQPVYIWTNKKNKPHINYKKKNIVHIHTKYSNTKLQILWFFNFGPSISQITNLKKYIYFCPDIRPQKIDSHCLRSVQYIHDIAFIKYKKSIKLKTRLWFYLCNVKKLYKNSDIILTNSKFSKSEITKQYGYKKISIIHPSIPNKLKQEKIRTTKNYYLIISTLQKRKNIQKVINLFKKRTETLYIIGVNEKMYKKYSLSKHQNIKILQNISDEQKHYLIKNSIATIYPSKYEGFGLPILESIRLQKSCYTHKILPYTELFKNLTTPISELFKNKIYIRKPASKIISLKKETRKLKRLIYSID
jgi:hypothetical protein